MTLNHKNRHYGNKKVDYYSQTNLVFQMIFIFSPHLILIFRYMEPKISSNLANF